MLVNKEQQIKNINEVLEQYEIDKTCRDIKVDELEMQLIEARKRFDEMKQGDSNNPIVALELPSVNDPNINESSSDISDE